MEPVRRPFDLSTNWRADVESLLAQADEHICRLVALEKFTLAIDLLLRLLPIHEYFGMRDELGPLRALDQLGWLFWRVGKIKEARYFVGRANARRVRFSGEIDEKTLVSLEFQAVLANRDGELAEALSLYEQLLVSMRARHGALAPQTLRTLHNIGYLRRRKGDFPRARASYRLALRGRERVLGRLHRDTLQTAINLAVLYKVQGRFDEERAVYQRFLKRQSEPEQFLSGSERKYLVAMRKRLRELLAINPLVRSVAAQRQN